MNIRARLARFFAWVASLCERNRRRVLVSTIGDHAISGYLRSITVAGIEIDHAMVQQKDQHFYPLPDLGMVFIPTHRVELMQYLPDNGVIDLSPEPAKEAMQA